MDDEEKKPYHDQAAKDKGRADEEKAAYDVSLSYRFCRFLLTMRIFYLAE
jgi:hypothetical protein